MLASRYIGHDATIAQNDFGGLIRALGQLWQKEKNKDWTNQVVYLARPRGSA